MHHAEYYTINIIHLRYIRMTDTIRCRWSIAPIQCMLSMCIPWSTPPWPVLAPQREAAKEHSTQPEHENNELVTCTNVFLWTALLGSPSSLHPLVAEQREDTPTPLHSPWTNFQEWQHLETFCTTEESSMGGISTKPRTTLEAVMEFSVPHDTCKSDSTTVRQHFMARQSSKLFQKRQVYTTLRQG